MFVKIRKGNGFGGCLDYITRVKQDDKPIEKRVWKILDSDGVRLADGEKDWRKRAAADIERPTLSRSKIKDPCGHIALGFAPEDAHRLTDEFMTQVAKEYMEAMGIKNTPMPTIPIATLCSAVWTTMEKSSSPSRIGTATSAYVSTLPNAMV